MSEPIKVGDLVVVVKSLCGNEGKIGTAIQFVGDVKGFSVRHGPRWLVKFDRPVMDTWLEFLNPAPIVASWLRRIDPLSEHEGEKQDEEITA